MILLLIRTLFFLINASLFLLPYKSDLAYPATGALGSDFEFDDDKTR